MKFNVGDLVRLKTDVKAGDAVTHGGTTMTYEEDYSFKGTVKVAEVNKKDRTAYVGNDYWYSWDWLEKVFDWDAFKDPNKKIAVRCKTEEQAEDFCRQANKHGFTWSDGDSLIKYGTHWEYNNKNTAYRAAKLTAGGIMCGDVNLKKADGYKIIKWKPYMQAEPEKDYPKLIRLQYEILKRLSESGYKWLVRDKDCSVCYAYHGIPKRANTIWCGLDNTTCLFVPNWLDPFEFVTWEDVIPWSIEELLENCEVEGL